ncbi:X-linked retinitis pigmentosa GTPase regulator [Pundamilia nyererei]|uniref:X-linked retinitis pigmentosa GTPase regulator n=1 Tax=Pundamilia nyererei TaxID=303518 RepID=A0A9Y6M7S7_9CICH|nr:PREDICTED: X-linked retinitis pigmentosa GTPase regulator [Pundamilia nyererei]
MNPNLKFLVQIIAKIQRSSGKRPLHSSVFVHLLPETGAIFTFGRTSFANNVPSKFWLKNDHPKKTSCGGEHSAVITENGRLLMFGGNTWGQLGLRIKPSARKPTSVKALKSEKVKLAACGRDHTIVCTFHGSVYSAGSNQDGQLGLGHCDKSTYFHLLRPFCDWAPIKMLSAGCNTSAALTEDGRLFMWGDNSVGQIAFGDEGFAAEPREVHVGEAVIWVSCGYKHSAFVTVYGRLYTFGESANGRLGLQEEQLANHRIPQQVQGVLGHVTRVCCGGEHTVVLTEKNMYTFGRGQYGQLGHGTFLFEVHLPKALQHFCNSKVRHIACGENHTAVVTDSGLLYTFGDGRHGKLGLGEENFINQFSPTLCTRFLQYAVQSVSCGGHHMLVLATPRPAESQEAVPEKDVLIADYFLESSFTKIIFKNKFISPTPPSPLSALSARARHRDRVRSVELFGDKFQSLPRLNSDFLNTSRQTSRNSLTLKTLSNDATTPSSSPKPKSEVTGSPLLSPRSRSISPQSPLLSSKASTPHSQSSFTLQSKASTSASSKSKCKKVPSPLLLPKSITKLNPSSPVATKMTAKPRLNRAAATKKPLSNKFSSPVPPKEPYTPTRPPSNVFIKNLKEEEHPAPTQTENVKRQIITEEVEEKEVFSPYMGKKKGRAFRHAVKEAEPFAQQIQTDRNSPKVLPTELMKGPSTLKTEVSPLKSTKKNHKVTSNSKENITKESSNIKPSENRQAQKQLPHFKSSQQDKRKPSEHSTKTQQTLTDAQERVTEVKHKTRKTEDLRESNKPNEEDNSSLKKGLTRTPKKETKKSSSLDPKSPSIKVSKVNQAASLASTENAVKENEATQRGSDDVKPVEVASRGTRRVKSTLTKDQHKVKSVPGVDAKSPAAQEENTTPFKAETKKSVSRKTPLQVKGKLQELKPTPVKDQSKCAENPLIEGESKEKCEENELNCVKDATLKMKGGTVDEQKLSKIKDKKTAKTKRRGGGKEEEIRVKGEGDVDSENKMKAKPKSEASSLPSSQQDTPTEVRGNPISPQSPEVDSPRAAKPLQGAKPVVMDSRVSETDEEDTQGKNGGKTNWGEILSNSASLLPVAGIAGAAIEVLREAVTSVQSDSDKATSTPSKTLSKVRQFTKQSAVTEPSLCSTLSHFSSSNETEDGLKTDAQAGVPSESVNESQEVENDDSSRDPSEGEAVKGGLSEQIRGEHMEDSQKEVEEKSDKASGEDEDSEDGGKNEDEDVESGSDSEDKREECESSSDKETGEESNTGEGEEDNVSEEEEGEEESSKKTSDGLSDSDGSEGAEEEEEEGENEESSDEESKEDKEEESKMSEDEEKKSGDESESDESTNRESEGEEDGEEGDTAESAKTEEEENDEDEEGETEEQNDASTENEDEEKDSVEDEEADKSEGEQDSDKGEEEEDSEADEEELQDEKSDEEEEEEGGEEREEKEEEEEDTGDEDIEAEEEEEEKEEDTGDEETEAEEEKEEDTGDEEEAEEENESEEEEKSKGKDSEEEGDEEERDEENKEKGNENQEEEETFSDHAHGVRILGLLNQRF